MSAEADRTGGPANGIALDVGPDPSLRLWLRLVPARPGTARAAILLLHGGNSSGDTFLLPEGGIANFLAERGWDVWILEWRGSPYVVQRVLDLPPRSGSSYAEIRGYTFDAAAEWDLPAALRYITERSKTPLVVLGHCVGSAVVSLALARGHLAAFNIAAFVLCEVGLFVETTWNGWLKPEDFILERVLANDPACRSIDPKRFQDWPASMTSGHDVWPQAWLPEAGRYTWQQLLHHLSFMVGQPYVLGRLHSALRTSLVEPVFGPMHLGLYLHAAQSVRRGFLAPFNTADIIDRRRVGSKRARETSPPVDVDLNPTQFRGKRIILASAGQSRLWHRDSVDLMYEWLRNSMPRSHGQVTKLVFQEEGLQELFWGRDCKDVYEGIRSTLRPICL